MLKRLHLKNFTVFADADFEFSPGLNVLVGTNGTGKSHVLKLGYAVEMARFEINKHFVYEQLADAFANRSIWKSVLRGILSSVFLSSPLDSLVRWDSNNKAQIEFSLDDDKGIIDLSMNHGESKIINENSKSRVHINSEINKPVFIPAKEILTLSWMLPGSEQLIAPIEKNYLDLLGQLRLLPLRKPEENQAIQALTDILGGEIQEENDRYYLTDKTGRRTGISMVAEGLRKFGALQKLLANGSLTKNTTLYWDEPESNLNPALLRQLAAILAELARQGFQIILATHSTDLLKEFHILSRRKDAKPLLIKYFGLNAEPGEATRVVSTDNFEFLPDVVALQAELEQVDELDAIFAREDRERHADL